MFDEEFEEEVFKMDIIATENIVYAFFHLGPLKEASRVSGYMYKEKKIII